MFTSLSTSTGQPSSLADRLADGEPVPAGHDRRDDRHALPEADRPGHADPDAVDLVRALPRRAACRSGPAPVRAPRPGPAARRTASDSGRGSPARRWSPRRRSRWRRCRRRRTAGGGRAGRCPTAGRHGRPPARPARPDRARPAGRARRRAWTGRGGPTSPSSARDRAPSSRSSRSSCDWCAFSGRAVIRVTPSSKRLRRERYILSCGPQMAMSLYGHTFFSYKTKVPRVLRRASAVATNVRRVREPSRRAQRRVRGPLTLPGPGEGTPHNRQARRHAAGERMWTPH